jgi:hypothetical protein
MARSQEWIRIDRVSPTDTQIELMRAAIASCKFAHRTTLLVAVAEIDLETHDDESGATIILRAAQEMAELESERTAS